MGASGHPSGGVGNRNLDVLQTISDEPTRSAADLFVNGAPDPAAARAALSGAFDRPVITDLQIYSIGDGEAMSGLLVAARDTEIGKAILVSFLVD